MGYKNKEEIQVINMRVFKLNQLLERVNQRRKDISTPEKLKRLRDIRSKFNGKYSTFTKTKNILKKYWFYAILCLISSVLLSILIII